MTIEPGDRFGRTTVVELGEPYYAPSNPRKKVRRWTCRCDCGRVWLVQQSALTQGKTTSCGKGKCNSQYGNRGERNHNFGRKVVESQSGEDNPMFGRKEADHPRWKGDSIGSAPFHKRLRKARGKASEHPCVDTGLPADHWSWIGCAEAIQSDRGPFCLHYEHYEPRTASAHKRFDLERLARERRVA